MIKNDKKVCSVHIFFILEQMFVLSLKTWYNGENVHGKRNNLLTFTEENDIIITHKEGGIDI